MIRIFTTQGPAANTIIIDGQLVGAYVKEVESCVSQALEQQKPVHIFLRNVSNIDDQGRALLSRLAVQGVKLSASGVYSSYFVAEIRREASTLMEGWQSSRRPV
jgi:hypothetical protein